MYNDRGSHLLCCGVQQCHHHGRLLGQARDFHVSEEVGLLAITVFVVGFGVGKLIHLVFL